MKLCLMSVTYLSYSVMALQIDNTIEKAATRYNNEKKISNMNI